LRISSSARVPGLYRRFSVCRHSGSTHIGGAGQAARQQHAGRRGTAGTSCRGAPAALRRIPLPRCAAAPSLQEQQQHSAPATHCGLGLPRHASRATLLLLLLAGGRAPAWRRRLSAAAPAHRHQGRAGSQGQVVVEGRQQQQQQLVLCTLTGVESLVLAIACYCCSCRAARLPGAQANRAGNASSRSSCTHTAAPWCGVVWRRAAWRATTHNRGWAALLCC
jgi:hypothetical protein